MIINTILAFASTLPDSAGMDPLTWLLSALKWTVEQFQAGNLAPAVSGVIMVLVWAFNMFLKNKMPSGALPWVSAGLGVLGSVAANLAGLVMGAQPMAWLSAILMGFMSGAAASGMWSLVGRLAVSKLSPAAPPVDPPPSA